MDRRAVCLRQQFANKSKGQKKITRWDRPFFWRLGSAEEGYEHKRSDIDIAVLFDLEIKLGNRLQEALKRRVDLLVLNRSDPSLVFKAIRGALLLGKDPTTRARFEAKMMGRYYQQRHYQLQPLASTVKLERHPKYPEDIFYRYFKVVGKTEKETGVITVTLGKEKCFARVTVAPPKEGKRKDKITPRKGGFITDIIPNSEENPQQRARYDKTTGVIEIFVNFPSVAKFIKSGFEGANTEQGKILMAELVGEAFIRAIVRKRLEKGAFVPLPGSEFEAFNQENERLQKKFLHLIQEVTFSWEFK